MAFMSHQRYESIMIKCLARSGLEPTLLPCIFAQFLFLYSIVLYEFFLLPLKRSHFELFTFLHLLVLNSMPILLDFYNQSLFLCFVCFFLLLLLFALLFSPIIFNMCQLNLLNCSFKQCLVCIQVCLIQPFITLYLPQMTFLVLCLRNYQMNQTLIM